MPSRHRHSKSRHGCTRCKQRRVKCDELAPCQNCVRRNEECSLLQDYVTDPTPWPRFQVQLSCPNDIDTTFLSHLLAGPSVEKQSDEATWGHDLFLMGHFTSFTAHTISSRTEVRQLWQSVVPEEAVSYPFLAHGMLALSAMHLASLRPSQRSRYEQCCRRHQDKAILGYRRAIQNIMPEASGPVFAMTSLVALLGLATISDNALCREDAAYKNQPTFTDVMSIFTIIRGLGAILADGTPLWHNIINSNYRVAMTGHMVIDSQDFKLPANVELRYQQLTTDCLDTLLAGDKSAKQTCLEAIGCLQNIHRELLFLVSKYAPDEEASLEPAYVVKWFALVSPQFIEMLRQKNTAALVILGDFFALFRLEVIDQRGLEWLIVLQA
ncbi:C6 transcription factor [Fusarium phyllophilum]|uniref:C6 transcription factor n=1 Tax=Fusarium phyllophilum TaxID=47803 RepID=A0A8H5N1I8_9HYPO|nr:C6 transcription factor [Fusarium phyllophilum]